MYAPVNEKGNITVYRKKSHNPVLTSIFEPLSLAKKKKKKREVQVLK